ncbi:universal stress protein [Reichenbachiella sp. MALMAid0571]|uniref:universal stress protein n=1 Tax=Reichenbachiella sp. MALMAid0571 TaxID=3143939 RepID=UPI0032DFD4AD
MKKILVPTDFSEVSGHALEFARQLAERDNCQILLLNIIEHPSVSTFNSMGITGYDPMENLYIKKMIDSVKVKMEDLRNSPEFSGIDIKTKVVVGNPFVEITEDIVKTETDLVVMGTEGTEGMEELLVGSNAEKVIRTSQCPVLTIKSKTSIDDIKNIVFASDFKSPGEGIVAYIKEMQSLFEAKLSLVTVNTPNNFTTTRQDFETMEEFATSKGLENYTMDIYNDFQEEDGIICFAQDIEADMIAIGTHGRTGVFHFLSGSIAEDVANHSNRPVWTFRIEEK